jgi:hypothetical protein
MQATGAIIPTPQQNQQITYSKVKKKGDPKAALLELINLRLIMH